jgi:hypothetical protein
MLCAARKGMRAAGEKAPAAFCGSFECGLLKISGKAIEKRQNL